MGAADFHYLAKNTAFATNDLVEEYYNNLMDKYPDGKMSTDDFIATFRLAFPSRPEDKVIKLADEMANKDGNKVITIDELLNLMSVFIEIGEGKDHKVDLATVMAEMYHKGDADKNEKLEVGEFCRD